MKISVIVPFYNLERYVRECLDSVMAAAAACPEAEVEVLAVDDGSTDATPRLLDGYCADGGIRNPSVRVIHKPNGGEGSARNAGIEASTGDYLTFLDGDDVWLPNMLTAAVQRIVANPEADIIAFRYADFQEGAAVPEPAGAARPDRDYPLAAGVPDEVVIYGGVFPTFFRREALGTDRFSALPLGADRLYMARRFAAVGRVVMCDDVVHGYRIRPGSMARAVWNARKVMSQCDYARGSLEALAESGRSVGPVASAYLASIWLSDVPARIARLKDPAERHEAFGHWLETLDGRVDRVLPDRYRTARKLLKALPGESVRIAAARLLRHCGF